MSTGSELVLIKLGGSLITDKAGVEAVRGKVLARLTAEVGEVVQGGEAKVVLGHGSGSFGHVAAAGGGWTAGDGGPTRETLARTQDAAARLHREVISALLDAGQTPFSLAPGSMMASRGGRLSALGSEPLVMALESDLLPVTFGDVVLDSEKRARIFSTESVFLSIVPALLARGYRIAAAYWLGVTDGILDSEGQSIEVIDSQDPKMVLSTLEAGDAGDGVWDVTGGMRHRLEATLELARLGIPSRILDGRSGGALARALAGEETRGTHVLAGP